MQAGSCGVSRQGERASKSLQATRIASQELSLVRDEVNNMEVIRSLSDALQCGMAILHPKSHKLDLSAVDFTPIQNALTAVTTLLAESSEDFSENAAKHISERISCMDCLKQLFGF